MPRLPAPTRTRRAVAWRSVLVTLAMLLLGLAALTRAWALVSLAAALGLAAALVVPPGARRGGW